MMGAAWIRASGRRFAITLWGVASAAAIAWIIVVWLVVSGVYEGKSTQLIDAAANHLGRDLDVVAAGVTHSLDGRRGVPKLLAQTQAVQAALRNTPPSAEIHALPVPERRERWTQDPQLAALGQQLDTTAQDLVFDALWVMNADGDTIAASNVGTPGSFVGANFATRSYFRSAQDGALGYQYAWGKVSNIPGLYFSAPVRDAKRFLGAVVGKIHLTYLKVWIDQGDEFVTDDHGVIILAGDKALETHALPSGGIRALNPDQQKALYGRDEFPLLELSAWGDPRFPQLLRIGSAAAPALVLEQSLPGEELSVHAFRELPELVKLDQDRNVMLWMLWLVGALLILVAALATNHFVQIHGYNRELNGWRAQFEDQTELGMHVMSRLTATEGLRDPLLKHFNIPAERFSGDLLCAARSPTGAIHLMLGDATGHGLPAALSAMPMTQIFYSMSDKGFPIGAIATELNRKLKSILPADRFVAATLAAIDPQRHSIEVWNGGNPDALLVDRHRQLVGVCPSRHLPLGILSEAEFSGLTETQRYLAGYELVIFSDGLIEAESPLGEMLGAEGVQRLLAMPLVDEDSDARLVNGVRQHLQASTGHDDISGMIAQMPVEPLMHLNQSRPTRLHRTALDEWQLDVTYSAHELRYLAVVPGILGFVTQVEALKPHQNVLFLILSELVNNALDHGLLQLDTSMRATADGFESYMQERETRLAALSSGQIDIRLHLHSEDRQVFLDLMVTDTGTGFDVSRLPSSADALRVDNPSLMLYGRGIALLRALCTEVMFCGTGNAVWVRYHLSDIAFGDEPDDAMG